MLVKTAARKLRKVLRRPTPHRDFHSYAYLRHNARRQEHLASLGLAISGMSVLEVGAGLGDHTHYFLDRGCRVTTTEARHENLNLLRKRYPSVEVHHLDLEQPTMVPGAPFDLVYCYGTLYHLRSPAAALQFLSDNCAELLLLETCVSFGDDLSVNNVQEDQKLPSQAVSGNGSRPSRPWVLNELQRHFKFVYVPVTQPNHEEFPIDWTRPDQHTTPLSRAVFIGSRSQLGNPLLSEDLPSQQRRHL